MRNIKIKEYRLNNVRSLIHSKNGILLSEEYTYSNMKLKIQCKNNHICNISWKKLKQNQWCAKCAKKTKPTLKERQELIQSKYGILLSEKYKNAHKKLKIKCKNDHCFEMCWTKIQQDRWCPECKIPISELIYKHVIEKIFNKPFLKIRPEFLKNPKTNYNLEIDMYNEELNVGLEHQGRHHYEDNVYSNKNELKSIQERDQLKLELCKLNNTKLIIISELFDKTKLKDLQNFIISECKKQNIQLPNNIPQIKIDINEIIRNWYNLK